MASCDNIERQILAEDTDSTDDTDLNSIAFFWIGQDLAIPTLLVRSIRRAFGADFKVHQLSDRDTPRVAGVSIHKPIKLSPHIMVARLEAYAASSINEPTLFVDADMLVTRRFDLPPLADNEVGVTIRGERDTIRFVEREWAEFPEFTHKDSAQMMPYIFSFVYVSSPVLFLRQLNALKKMPKRFHRWYGDQMTLKSELDAQLYAQLDAPKRFAVKPFDVERYNRTVRSRWEFAEVISSPAPACLVHFKGPESKVAMAESLAMLEAAAVAT